METEAQLEANSQVGLMHLIGESAINRFMDSLRQAQADGGLAGFKVEDVKITATFIKAESEGQRRRFVEGAGSYLDLVGSEEGLTAVSGFMDRNSLPIIN